MKKWQNPVNGFQLPKMELWVAPNCKMFKYLNCNVKNKQHTFWRSSGVLTPEVWKIITASMIPKPNDQNP